MNKLTMTTRLRWIALIPSVAICFVATLLLIYHFRYFILRFCPRHYRLIEGVTELSQKDYALTIQSCSASWFPMAEKALIVTVLVLAIIVAGVIASIIAPAQKKASGAIVSFLGLVVIVATLFR
ncbi:hypothetical protein [Xanthomonas floridensis]|uniref:Transmembrane protein n=1 Tax=Xanthomonas floridensis TaxID=1843580 RepID=A0ABU5PZI6_9XANT|nr:hypothetical protein [Xanthomonas floridensis]MEA5124973.1 hypothetical protein [Xanthomonas floridensis]MEA5132479.1 hypothetical protein [Xanthomonas floridensis]